ncbi:MAG TPA: DMT family transporter [Thermoanaerobaculia bacterium]|nr:DMT family transporter [Thermoanaerobaculia bacterium]
MQRIGELAALGAATCWALSPLAFGAAGRRIGSLPVNLLRLWIALPLLAAASWAVRGRALPLDAGVEAWLWLGASGLVGFAFGDLCLFRAYVVLGPRRSTVVMSTVPVWTALGAWLFGGELLSAAEVAGMMAVVLGVGLAVLDRRPAAAGLERGARNPPTGLLLALGGAVGQAGGLVLAKRGLESYPFLPATQIRVLAGAVAFALLFTVTRQWRRVAAGIRDRRALGLTAAGAVVGPVAGVSLSLLAIQAIPAGVAASLMATTPVLILPLVALLGQERIGWRGAAGALLAVAGAVALFL